MHHSKWKIICYLNIFAPLCIGCLIYLSIRHDHYIYLSIEKYPVIQFLRNLIYIEYTPNNILGQFVTYHFTDFLWAYSLEWSVLNSQKQKTLATLLCAVYCSFMEVMQIWSTLGSTFDYWDIASQLFGVLCGYCAYKAIRAGLFQR